MEQSMTYDKIKVPAQGEAITVATDGTLHVPNNPNLIKALNTLQ